jgi:hypothetical protein
MFFNEDSTSTQSKAPGPLASVGKKATFDALSSSFTLGGMGSLTMGILTYLVGVGLGENRTMGLAEAMFREAKRWFNSSMRSLIVMGKQIKNYRLFFFK